MRDFPEWVSKYVGLPYKIRGRTLAGLDCYGLLVVIARDEFGVCIGSYEDIAYDGEGNDKAVAEEIHAGLTARWEPVERGKEQVGDCILFRLGRYPIHCGMVVAPGWMIHIEEGADSALEKYNDGPAWPRRLIGFYKWASNTPKTS